MIPGWKLNSHKPYSAARKRKKTTTTSPNHSKVSCVYFPKIRMLTYESIMQTSKPGNQHCNDPIVQSTDPIQILSLVPMKFCLSSLRSLPGTLLSLLQIGTVLWSFPAFYVLDQVSSCFFMTRPDHILLAEILQERCCVFFSTLYQGCIIFIHHTLGDVKLII